MVVVVVVSLTCCCTGDVCLLIRWVCRSVGVSEGDTAWK